MTSIDELQKVSGFLLADINRQLEKTAAEGNENLCNLIQVETIFRLSMKSETGDIAREIMQTMFPDEVNNGRVTVGYDKTTLKVKVIVKLKN